MCNDINIVLKDTRRYEAAPIRCYAIPFAIQQTLRTECQGHDPDSPKSALTDWSNVGLLGGFKIKIKCMVLGK